jgi:hypothetical protein
MTWNLYTQGISKVSTFFIYFLKFYNQIFIFQKMLYRVGKNPRKMYPKEGKIRFLSRTNLKFPLRGVFCWIFCLFAAYILKQCVGFCPKAQSGQWKNLPARHKCDSIHETKIISFVDRFSTASETKPHGPNKSLNYNSLDFSIWDLLKSNWISDATKTSNS